MELLNASNMAARFISLFDEYSRCEFSVAWASYKPSLDIYRALNKNISKVKRFVVGLHFYQTSPEFIQKYKQYPAVRFILKSDGTFHPKIYLFYNNSKDWTAIVGSSNFTESGFSRNEEANLLIDQNDSPSMFIDLRKMIETAWNQAKRFNDKDFENYRNHYNNAKPKIKVLSTFTKNKHDRITDCPLLHWEWNDYANRVKGDKYNALHERIEILDEAYDLFATKSSFKKMDYDERRKLAGFHEFKEEDLVDWKLFGSMKGPGKYKHYVQYLSESEALNAIDKIPLTGEVKRSTFNKYISAYKDEFGKNPLAMATRLLAMKRPDMFLCVNSKNKKLLCNALDIPQSHLTVDTYWDMVVCPIVESTWYSVDNKHLSKIDKEIFKYRVALLDSAFYI